MSSRIEHHAGPGSEASIAALKEIGHLLRETRQARGEDLYDVADYLRIKPSYLFALEDGDLALTPGRVYALGFLRSYGEHLGFDGEELVSYAKQAMSGPASRPQLNYRVPAPESRRPSGILLAASILTVGLVYGGWRMLYHDQPVLERVSAVPGDIGRLASQVFTLGDEGPAGQAPDADRSSSVATSATAATPAANEVATQPQGVAPLASMAADPESALASTPQPPITPASTVVGPQALAAPTLSIDAQTALRDGRVASAGETTLPATSAAAATPAAAAPGTPDPLTAAPSAGETAPLGTPAASTRAAASATEAADPVAAASTTSADRGGARALLASLESGGPASGGAAAAPRGSAPMIVSFSSRARRAGSRYAAGTASMSAPGRSRRASASPFPTAAIWRFGRAMPAASTCWWTAGIWARSAPTGT